MRALRTRAYDLYGRKQYADAAALWQQGYKQAVAHHDTYAAIRFLNNIGGVHFGLLHYREAIDAFVEVRKLAQAIHDDGAFSAASGNLCSLHMQMGDIRAAATAAEEGLRIPASPRLAYRAGLLMTLGLLFRSDDPDKALNYFQKAVQEAETDGPDGLRAETWSKYAQQLLRTGNLPYAEVAALNAYRLGHLPAVRESRRALLTLAQIYRARGDNRTALGLIEQGLAIPARTNDRQLWNRDFLYERAMVRAAEGHPDTSLADLSMAISHARDWREVIAPSDNLRTAVEFWLKDVYDAYIDAATKTNAPREAFLAVEEERSASLLQMLAYNRGAGQDRRWPDTYWQDLARLRAVEIMRVASPKTYDEKAAAQIRRRLSEAEAQAGIDFLLNKQEKGENILSPDTLLGVQRNMDPEELILSLHSGPNASFLWAVSDNRLEMHRLPPPGRLAATAERFRRAVEESTSERDLLGRELYAELFGNLSPSLLSKRSWIITSDDALFNIPFEALVVDDHGPDRSRPVYLIERHDTRRIPTVFMLPASRTPIEKGPFLGIGDGIYNIADERWIPSRSTMKLAGFSYLFEPGSTTRSMELPRLASSTAELRSSAAAWNSNSSFVSLTGTHASRSELLAALRIKPAVIHIAAHFLYPDGSPDQALIHLGLSPEGTPDVLTTKDVSRLHVDRALVVLSGCGSAAAKSVRGAGFMGLTRAWLLAGARAVVGSRWPVNDDAGDLFRSFYAHLTTSQEVGSGLASALRQAQLQMLRSHSWRSDPKYWGAFYLLAKE